MEWGRMGIFQAQRILHNLSHLQLNLYSIALGVDLNSIVHCKLNLKCSTNENFYSTLTFRFAALPHPRTSQSHCREIDGASRPTNIPIVLTPQ